MPHRVHKMIALGWIAVAAAAASASLPGCSRQRAVESPAVVPTISIGQADGVNGAPEDFSPEELNPEGDELYRNNCEPCHGPLLALRTAPSTGVGQLLGADVEKIKRSGIVTANTDKNLTITTLSDEELTSIADVLRLMAEAPAASGAPAPSAGPNASGTNKATTEESTKKIVEGITTITKIIAANS